MKAQHTEDLRDDKMKLKVIKFTRNIAILFLLLSFFYQANSLIAGQSINIILDLEYEQIHCSIDGNSYPHPQIISYLENQIISGGRNTPIKIIFNKRISFSEIINLRGIIQKIGFGNINYFYFGDSRRKMAEITLDKPAIPFLNMGSDRDK